MIRPVVEGLEEAAAKFAVDLAPLLPTIGTAVAAEAQDRIAPYPAAPGRSAKRWYERGFGQRWLRADGSIGGRKTSESMGRKWAISSSAAGAELRNTASYSGFVHAADSQATIHAASGWKTDKGVTDQMQADGTIEQMTAAAIKKALGEA